MGDEMKARGKKSDKDELFNQVWAERIFEVAPILLIR